MSLAFVGLSWDDVNQIEEGHKIYRSNASINTSNPPTPIAILGKDTTSYTDTDVDVDATYYYRVSAYTTNAERFSEEIIAIARALSLIYVASVNGEIAQYDNSGALIWTNDDYVTGSVSDLITDIDGNVVVVYSDKVVKLNRSGNEIWNYSVSPTGIAFDLEGNVYVSTLNDVRVLDSQGTLADTISITGNIVSIDMDNVTDTLYVVTEADVRDGNDNIIISEVYSDVIVGRNKRLYLLGSNYIDEVEDGNIIKRISVDTIVGYVMDNRDNIFINTGDAILKYSDIESQWLSTTYTNGVADNAVSSNGITYIVSGNGLYEVDSEGTERWTETFTESLTNVEAFDGYLFVEPSNLDINYVHFYEPTDLDFFSS